MARTTLVAVAALALGLPALAQDAPTPRHPLVLDPPPEEWTPHPAEEKPFAYDFDLPATGGETSGPRVNVLDYPLGFDDYRAKIRGRWRRADGTRLAAEDQAIEELDANGLRVRVVDQRGTQEPKDGPPHAGWRLVAAHIRAPGGQWTAWLIGPAAGVEAHRAAYLAWLRTARLGPAPTPPAGDTIRDVRFAHGAPPHRAPSPWALLGHRIGTDALTRLAASRAEPWQLVVTLRALEGDLALAALDGLLAATGASPGNGNLHSASVAAGAAVEVEVLHRPSGRILTYRVVPALATRLRAVATADFPQAALDLAALAEGDAFTVVESRKEER